MVIQTNDLALIDTDLIDSRIGRIDPDNFQNQSGASIEDGDDDFREEELKGDDEGELYGDEGELYEDEPTDEDAHQQDDNNYTVGGQIPPSGS